MKMVKVKQRVGDGRVFEVNEVYYLEHRLQLDRVEDDIIAEIVKDDVIEIEEVRKALKEKGIKFSPRAKVDTLLRKLAASEE